VSVILDFSDWVCHLALAIYESYKGTIMILMGNEVKEQLLKTGLERARRAMQENFLKKGPLYLE
jgi:hypothetical protein